MRPHVTVHMMISVDGRIVPGRWTPFEGRGEYERVHAALEGDAWMCGRVTMAGFAKGAPYPSAEAAVPRADHVARTGASAYAVALDPSGKLAWGRGEIDGDPVVVVLGERVPDAHLAGLRRDGVSYVFAGPESRDLALALRKLGDLFGIRRLLVEGGGRINGSFLAAGLVDELSLLLAPSVDGLAGAPALFAADRPAAGLRLALLSAEPREGGVVWLRYRVGQA